MLRYLKRSDKFFSLNTRKMKILKINFACLALATLMISSCQNPTGKLQSQFSDPPQVEKRAKELIKHDDVRVDEYYWLNERENPEVIDYLNAENSYLE